MKVSFLGQGYEPESKNSVGNHLLDFLARKDFHSFIGISAFASEAGVLGLAERIEGAKKNFKSIILIVGVDEEGTSKEALYEINNLKIDSYIFHQKESPIFHPKIYVFIGDKETKFILGSSNLTGRGLFNNVESSLLIEFENKDKDGLRLINEFFEYYDNLLHFKDLNLFKISEETIKNFIALGIVPNESTRRKRHGKNPVDITKTESKSTFSIPKRPTAKVPSFFRGKPKTIKPIAKFLEELGITDFGGIEPGSLAWQKLSLSQSDAQHVPSGTAITANLKLSQAKFKVDGDIINQTNYFRHTVFNDLNWVKTKTESKTYEEALCKFDIKILGKSVGIHELKLSHDIVRVAGQGNTPTWLHWGNALLPILGKMNVTGKTLSLYYPSKDSVYSIVIS